MLFLAFISRGRRELFCQRESVGRDGSVLGIQTLVVGKYRGREGVPGQNVTQPSLFTFLLQSEALCAGERAFIVPPPSARAATATRTDQSGAELALDEPHIGGVRRSRHRSENKQRYTQHETTLRSQAVGNTGGGLEKKKGTTKKNSTVFVEEV